MEAARSSQTIYQLIQCHSPEDFNFYVNVDFIKRFTEMNSLEDGF